jgi:hypothetical protein
MDYFLRDKPDWAEHGLALLLRVAGVFCVACCGLFFWQLRNTAREVQNTVREIQHTVRDADMAVRDTQKRVADTSQNLNAALLQVGLATDEARRASVEQRQYWNRISRETIGLIADARTTVRQTGNDIDGVARDLHDAAGDLHSVAGASVDALNGVGPLMDQGTRTLGAANALLADPEITKSLKNLAESSQSMAATTVNVEKMSEDLQKRMHQMTQPKSIGKAVLVWLLDTAYKVKALF